MKKIKRKQPKYNTDSNGNRFWYKNNKRHREDGPAIEYINGDKHWYKNGQYHREDGPAVENSNGHKEYWVNGKCHREDGPAIEYTDGRVDYWLNGKVVEEKDLPINQWPKCSVDESGNKYWKNEIGESHRINGPAVEWNDGDKWWYKNGKLHREDGPAREYANGGKEYWLNGKHVNEEDLPINKKEEWPKYSVDESGNKVWKNEKGQYHREDGPAIECINDYKAWLINGKYHRKDGPAVEYSNGTKEYWLNGSLIKEKDLPMNKNKKESKCKILKDGTKKWYKGNKRHRENGPAVEYTNGNKEYWINGNLHREDGPAIERSDGYKEYWLNGNKVQKEDLPINKKKEIIKEEWPKCITSENGTKRWENKDGFYHREDGPAYEGKNGDKEWYINGKKHREDGPACEYANGCKYYYLNGKEVKEKDLPINQWPKCSIDESGNKEWINEKGIRHREDGPAWEGFNGDKSWWVNGLLHREDKPAIEWANGDKFWYKNGLRHREDGSAIEYADGRVDYYLHGKLVEEKDLPINQWPKCTIQILGNKEWKNKEGELHRLDGPAWIGINGDKAWYKDGNLHRENGPANEWHNGHKEWYKNGELHREDGPACEYANGNKSWWLNGLLHREDGPAIENINGFKEYYLNGNKVEEKDLPINIPLDKEIESSKLEKIDLTIIDTSTTDGWEYLQYISKTIENSSPSKINDDLLKLIQKQILNCDGIIAIPTKMLETFHKEKIRNIIKEENELNEQITKIKYIPNDKTFSKEEWPKCITSENGTKRWENKDGFYHRLDGPAYEGKNGDKEYWINGKLHREDGPACEYANGDKYYYLNGIKVEEKDLPINKKEEWPKCTIDKDENKEWKNEQGYLHREGGPAIECSNGDKFWYINGKCHREDGPAVECSNGDKYWYKNNKIHREDGPARECANGDKYWYKNGELHRENGPAKVYANGTTEYWTNGQLNNRHFEITGVDYNILNDLLNKIYMKPENINKYKENEIKMEELNFAPNRIKINTTPITSDTDEWPKYSVDTYGNKRWVNKNGLYNREDGPAIEYSYGTKEWWINGNLHRENKPAIECFNGDKYWYKNDKLHREDGPAMEYANGFKAYYLNGEKVEEKDLPMNKEEEWPKCEIDQFGSKMWKNEKGQLHRLNGPAVENINGHKAWYKNGLKHREDGPACEYANGSKEWYKNGLKHREDGPAGEYVNRRNEYWLNANKVEEKEWYINGLKHREDGPAMEYANGFKAYYLNGEKIEEKDLPINQWPKCEIDKSGTKFWKNKEGLYHRENGPAVENINGDKEWYVNGQLHREDGPACEYANGDNLWYINGKEHREDGPAVEFKNGYKVYYLNGEKIEEKDLPINKDIKKVIQQPLNVPESHIISGNHVTVPEFEIISSPTIQIADIKARCNVVDSLMQKTQQEIIDKEDSDCFAAFIETKLTDIPQKENKVFTMIKQDGTKASYRIVSKQMTKMVKNSILQIIKTANPSAKSQISSVSKFLDTDVGKSFISFILGLGLGNTPKIKDNKHMIKICKELRVEGMSTAGNFIVNEVLKNVIPLISNKEKLRIESVSIEEQIVSDELITDEQIEEKKNQN